MSYTRITIADVARKAGVSITAVSRALNRPPSESRLSEETRRVISDAADALGYRPSYSARALVNGRTGNIGVLYVGANPLLHPVFGPLMSSLSTTLRKHHYRMLLVPVSDLEEQDWRSVLEHGQVDGCVLAFGVTPALSDTLSKRRVPAVLMNLDVPLPLPRVLVDDVDGSRQATRHLLSLGHSRIAYLYAPRANPRPSVTLRRDGFLAEMQDAGLAGHATVHYAEASHFAAELAGDLERGPTAVICYNHGEAIDLYHALWHHGLSVPRDLSVIAFNDLYPAEVMTPPLTTVALPLAAVGEQAGEIIVRQLGGPGEPPTPETRIVLPERLVVRQSTAPPAADS